MTLSEAAALLGVTPDTLRQQIAKGKLRASKRGRDWWVTKAEVERYRKESRRERSMEALAANADLDRKLAEEGLRNAPPIDDEAAG